MASRITNSYVAMPVFPLHEPPGEGRLSLRLVSCSRFRPGPHRPLPLLLWRVCAGFPSPADDYVEEALDLNDLLVRNPPATFMMRVSGRSMEPAGIDDGDLLVVDRSLEARTGDVVIAYLNGELAVKRIATIGGRLALVADNGAFPPIEITEAMDFDVWGVVTHVIHSVR